MNDTLHASEEARKAKIALRNITARASTLAKELKVLTDDLHLDERDEKFPDAMLDVYWVRNWTLTGLNSALEEMNDLTRQIRRIKGVLSNLSPNLD